MRNVSFQSLQKLVSVHKFMCNRTDYLSERYAHKLYHTWNKVIQRAKDPKSFCIHYSNFPFGGKTIEAFLKPQVILGFLIRSRLDCVTLEEISCRKRL